ncbi:hypothetical protein [Streptomyces malaysiensis]|uniref:Uncharacterized protein n=1 Tax=Streptomyces autolyticus TaxID=75293 RepID=A0ABN4VY90_9ACTN|nr:hypothetical protein [Streptomyces autolyticus]AQA09919.1 hypothetical protein BV401_04810 [Streptomyces autolyticus]
MSDHDHLWGSPVPSVPPVGSRATHPTAHRGPYRTTRRAATMPHHATAPPSPPPPPERRSPWQRPWPWPARAACAALTCHVAAVVVNCAAEGVVNLGAGGGFTVGAMLIGLDTAVLLTVLARAHRRSGAAGEGER